MKKIILILVVVCFMSACATDPYTGESKVAKTAWGTGIGAAAGAGIGALIGGKKGALIGAGIGGATGAATGGYMDIQASKLRQRLRLTMFWIRLLWWQKNMTKPDCRLWAIPTAPVMIK